MKPDFHQSPKNVVLQKVPNEIVNCSFIMDFFYDVFQLSFHLYLKAEQLIGFEQHEGEYFWVTYPFKNGRGVIEKTTAFNIDSVMY